jgi:hypothetical protein
MPRRNRNATTSAQPGDLHGTQLALLCAACCRRPATTGTYCAPCKGAITRQARRAALKGR